MREETLTLQAMDKLGNHIRLMVFDADDTLWALQNHFEDVEREYCSLLASYGSREQISASLFATETANMEDLGYGCKAFTISLVENAVKVSRGKVEATVIAQIVKLGKTLLHLDAQPLDGVERTLERLLQMPAADGQGRRFRLAVFTKGELKDQENKLRRSGLARFFENVRIVSDKTPQAYRDLCRDLHVQPRETVMVGNSFKSDILPALDTGAYAIHIPFHTTWAHEIAEECEHERLCRLSRFEELLNLV